MLMPRFGDFLRYFLLMTIVATACTHKGQETPNLQIEGVEEIKSPPLPYDIDLIKWSPQGDKVAILETIEGFETSIYQFLIKVLSSDFTDMLYENSFSGTGGSMHISWSSDGEKLIFLEANNSVREIHLVDIETKSDTIVSYNTDKCQPKFMPNSSLAVMLPCNQKQQKLEFSTFDTNTGSSRFLFAFPNSIVSVGQFAISPSGNLALVVADQGDQKDLFLVDIPSSEIEQLTSDATPERSPVWSPTEDGFVYIRGWTSDSELVLQNLSTLSIKTLAIPNLRYVDWHPNGTHLYAIVINRTGHYLLRIDISKAFQQQ